MVWYRVWVVGGKVVRDCCGLVLCLCGFWQSGTGFQYVDLCVCVCVFFCGFCYCFLVFDSNFTLCLIGDIFVDFLLQALKIIL